MIRFFSFLTMLILVSSCQKNDIIDSKDDVDSNQIGFNIYSNQPTTKGTAQEGSGLEIYNTGKVNVLVYAYDESKSWSDAPEYSMYFRSKLDNLSNSLSSPSWGFAPGEVEKRFYPTNKRIACFAYASDLENITGTTKNDNGLSITDPTQGVPTITYNIPSEAAKQPDLLVSERITDRISGKVTLMMKHALSRIGIMAVGKGQKISNISISGVADAGTLSLDINGNIDWDLTGANYDGQPYQFGMINSYIIFSEEPFNPLKSNGYLMMLPQTMTADVKLNFELNDKPVSVSLNQAGFPDWRPGEKVTYLIDVTSRDPIVSIDLGGNVLSNCYIINPSLTSVQELKIPVNRVNQFWGDSEYVPDVENIFGGNHGSENKIGANDTWTVSMMWYDAVDLCSAPGGKGVQLGKATGKGINDYFTIIIPAGFTLKGNISIGIAKGDIGPTLVNGGTTDASGGLLPGAGAKCLWSWHIWITDYNPYVENITPTDCPGAGKYATVPGGLLWQPVSAGFDITEWNIQNTIPPYTPYSKSTGNDIWTGNNRFMTDRPIGVRSKAFMCENRSNYIGSSTPAQNYESGANQSTTRYNGNGIMYYQFGRKDPFPADIKLYKLPNNTPVTYSNTANGVSAPVPVWYTIYNPLRMVNSGTGVDPVNNPGQGDWSSDTYAGSFETENILWCDPKTIDAPVAKSIFDPSPWGFRVPRIGSFNSFVKNYLSHKGTTIDNDVNNPADNWLNSTKNRPEMSDPSIAYYMLDATHYITFYTWGSRFWRTGQWNDGQGFNGQFWTSGTIPNKPGWDYYLLFSPVQQGYVATTPSSPSTITPPAGANNSVIRLNPQSSGIRASTMTIMSVQNQLLGDPGGSLKPWNYITTW